MVRGRQGLLRLGLVAAGACAVAAAAASPGGARGAASQAWPPFVLVAGLLVIGLLAERDGLFEAAGAWAARAPGGGTSLLVALLVVSALVTAVLNLDTAVVFMTPVLLHAARRRALDERPFLYGSVFTANAASLLLPGSNLTNLLVLAHEPVSGSTFSARMVLPWLVSVGVVLAFLAVVFRRGLRGGARPPAERHAARLGLGAVGVAGAAALVLALAHPALPVLGLALGLALLARAGVRPVARAASPALLLGVFAVAVALGTLARSAGDLTDGAGRWTTAWIAAGASLVVNNLPAAVVLSAHAPAQPWALLVGLDLGPNAAVTGSLSALLWLQVARANGARPSLGVYSLLGLPLAALGIAAALSVMS